MIVRARRFHCGAGLKKSRSRIVLRNKLDESRAIYCTIDRLFEDRYHPKLLRADARSG